MWQLAFGHFCVKPIEYYRFLEVHHTVQLIYSLYWTLMILVVSVYPRIILSYFTYVIISDNNCCCIKDLLIEFLEFLK